MNRLQAVAVVSDAVAGLIDRQTIGSLLPSFASASLSDEDWARLEAAKDIVTLRLFRMGQGGRA